MKLINKKETQLEDLGIKDTHQEAEKRFRRQETRFILDTDSTMIFLQETVAKLFSS